MMTGLSFRVYGTAQGMGSKTAFIPKGWTRPIVTDSNKSLRSWQALVATAAGRAVASRRHWQLLEAPVRLSLAFYFQRPRSLAKAVVANTKGVDVDKLARSVGDALSGIVYRDDKLVVELVAGRYYAATGESAHVDVKVEPTAGVRPSEWPAVPQSLFAEPLFRDVAEGEP